MSRQDVQRHVRQYATSAGINSNDDEHASSTSYFTRVEKAHKCPKSSRWTLTLRKLTPLHDSDGRLKVEWWTERFDAVVVAAEGEGDAAYTPPIPGLEAWARAFPSEIFHSREYRRPDSFANKVRTRAPHSTLLIQLRQFEQTVLVVGGFVSSIGISVLISSK